MNAFLTEVLSADQSLFLWLNGSWGTFWDTLMGAITNKLTWIPLYVWLIVAMVRAYGRAAIPQLITVLVCILLSDQIASSFMKPFFMRPRPCHDPLISHLVHTVNSCGGPYGFVSSHASTSFGLACILNLLPTRRFTGIKYLYLWAFLYSYSRIYVGVHYPLDILGGALVGLAVSLMVFHLFGFVRTRYFEKK